MKYFNQTRLLIAFSFFLFPFFLKAQMLEVQDATAPPLTPEALIKNIFLGEGIEVVDVQFDGNPQQVGFFNHGEDEIGLERGIIMTTGRASSAGNDFGADGTGSDFASTDLGGNLQDPDLTSIATSSVNDAVRFTITFRPAADTLRFRYVFASEEYPEWACNTFNDVFGFFISGPGLSGPYQNGGENIALVPGTNQAVSINNVHPQNGAMCPPSFEQFYHDNNLMPTQPVYDGFLDVFTAQAVVVPCEEYTIKLTIADIGDHIFDSGVFLEAKSFGTGRLEVQATTASVDGSIAEGCADGQLTFKLEFPPESDFPIDYQIIGTATNGVDYATIPTDLFIPAGDTSVSILLSAFDDSIVEGMETIGIDVQKDVCTRDTIWVFIRENELLAPQLPPDTTICATDTMSLDGSVPIDLPPPLTFIMDNELPMNDAFGNTPGVTSSQLVVGGVQPPILGPNVIQSVCINIDHRFVDDLDIFLISPDGQFLELTTDNGANCDDYINTCFTPDATVPITFWTGNNCGPGESPPFTGEFQPEGTWSDLWDGGDHPTNGTWELLLIDDSQGFAGTLLNWSITFEPVYKVFYRWTPTTNISCIDCPNPLITPDTTTTYVVTAYDTYGCEVTDSITVDVYDQLPPPTVTCGNVGLNEISFEWTEVPGSTGYQVNVNGQGWESPNGALTHTIQNLLPNDTITFEVVGLTNCPGETGTVTCWTPDCNPPVAVVDNITHVDCGQGNLGTVSVSASGGSGSGYVYTLGTESNATGFFDNVPAGTHTIIVEDSFGCATSVTAEVTQPNALTLSGVVIQEVSCTDGTDGILTVSVSGGTGPFSFNWDNAAFDSLYTNVSPGNHSVIVSDAEGCMDTLDISLDNPPAMDVHVTSEPVTCFGLNDGRGILTPSGGQGPYTYVWDAAAGNQTDSVAVNLSAGSYFATITDSKGCEATALVAVGQPPKLTLDGQSTDVSCFGAQNGSASVSASGGTPGYTYLWNNSETSPTLANLNGGTYSVTISDGNGCMVDTTFQILEPDSMVITFQSFPAQCFGENSGELIAFVSGGTSLNGYDLSWGNGTVGKDTLATIPAGTYCLTATDDNGCVATACADVAQPTELTLTT
ncbi:MAG: hypothetical protein D6714_13790, partial [Bacteroidetes bacterium]